MSHIDDDLLEQLLRWQKAIGLMDQEPQPDRPGVVQFRAVAVEACNVEN
jgi:hypothetical protein